MPRGVKYVWGRNIRYNNQVRTAYKPITSNSISAAIPNAITCGYFVYALISPQTFDKETINTLGIIFIIEFLILQFHLVFIFGKDDISESKSNVIGISLAPIVVLAILKEWVLCAATVWLIFSRVSELLLDRLPKEEELDRQKDQYTASGILYILCLLLLMGFLDNITTREIATLSIGTIYFGLNSIFILFNAYRAIIWILILSCIAMGGWVIYYLSFIRY